MAGLYGVDRGPTATMLMRTKQRKRIELGPLVVEFPRDGDHVGLVLLPRQLPMARARRRRHLSGVAVDAYAQDLGLKFPAHQVDSLVQLKRLGDPQPPGFAVGRTMHNNPTVEALRFSGQTVDRNAARVTIRTELRHPDGWAVIHHLEWLRGARSVHCWTDVVNHSAAPLDLEMLASFSFGDITPFAPDDAPGRLRLHRLRSTWSMEGRLESHQLEDLQLEPSWSGWGVRCERFGAVGSLPVSGYFPWVAIEDARAGVTWAAQLAHPGSWQIEVYRRDDTVSIAGGIADREFGHWTKRIAPGETFHSPTARLTCVAGGVDAVSAALLAETPALSSAPLPVVFNEWATSWGKPSHAAVVQLAERLRGTGVDTLVIDAGWYAPENGDWGRAHGDWIPNHRLYPEGLAATAAAIRANGLRPGLWFELETCGSDSELWHREDLLLRRDGRIVTTGNRRFLDFRNPATIDYLKTRVVDRLREGAFGYLKIDYNDNIGLGADGAESHGEALRQHLDGVRTFLRHLRAELPNLIIENCSSGGHRLEPSLMKLCDVGSFSDAHEGVEIPIIAANLHRAISPAQSLVWVVLRRGESSARTLYSLAAGFLGRICLSGDALQWTRAQWALLRRAIQLHARCAELIAQGETTRQGPDVLSYRHPQGWQAVLRHANNRKRVLVVAHSFSRQPKITVQLPPGSWRVIDSLSEAKRAPHLRPGHIAWQSDRTPRAFVMLLERTPAAPR